MQELYTNKNDYFREHKKGKFYASLLIPTCLNISSLLVPGAGLEPARAHHSRDFKYYGHISYLTVYLHLQHSVFWLIPWLYQ